jgi:hypothetical protein
MAITEPINLREWKAPPDQPGLPGKLFTCGRPGRGTHGRAKVPVTETVIDQWASGLPKADVLHVVSLLGHKTSGLSEFSYYPFRAATEPGTKPTFEDWLNARYARRFVVHEFPTIDGQGIQRDVLDAAGHQVLEWLRSGGTTLVIDSAGAERTTRVCAALGYTRVR